ncbi:hypothetical protein BB559_003251 [Furculomyces boomerangus]|uniref:AMP-dependent synthetase/ligase domain-containing protein n=2 Tax=Harpellales TaxID=61421 RepID=A0A2T9YMA0_9FUNG|nr:hypothetical protein BB559_003251 [Furculomyces boomerangus]PVZ99795.1 hypothetical protein BB558_004174 [Smittium angustum]
MDQNTFSVIFNSESSSQAVLSTNSSDTNANLTYADLKTQILNFISQAKALLGDTYSPGIALSSMLNNGVPCLIAFLGTALMRSIAAPLNSQMKQSEIEFYLEDTKTKVLIVHQSLANSNHEGIKAADKLSIPVWTISWDQHSGVVLLPYNSETVPTKHHFVAEGSYSENSFSDVQPSDIALVLHTSGTTGRPKAVPLTHANIAKSMRNIAKSYELTPSDRTFVVMPLFHVHGLIGSVMSSLYAGASIVLPLKYSATIFWNEFIKSESNWYSAVPTIHQIQLQKDVPENLPKIRFIRSCSASLAPSILEAMENKFKAPVLEAYAMTEASHQMCSNPLPPKAHKPASVGIPQGIELKILDDAGHVVHLGEVCIRGDNVTHGYLNNPSANESSFTKIYSEDGNQVPEEANSLFPGKLWFRTGDQGYLDEDGYLFLTGRIKELINRGGEKISPLEIDALLLKCPGVSDAVCFAVEHEIYGQEVAAAVIADEGSGLTADDVKKFVGTHVAAFKVPKTVYITEFFPRTATGKIQRRVVAEYFSNLKQ